MSLLNRKVDYALLVLCDLQERPGGGSAREVAQRFGLSRPFVANILKRLCQRGLVRSHRGIKGGYLLGRPASEIRVVEVMEALDTPFHLVPCCRPDDPCEVVALCPMRQALAALDRRIRDMLRALTVADLVRPCGEGTMTEYGLELAFRPGVAVPS
jgi:Rrf2 family protein